MVDDIRISFSFRGHRKRKKLKKFLGSGATGWLLNLWISTAMNRPKGILKGMDEEDIAIDAGFDGDPGVFVKAMVEVGFLDINDGVYCIHDWEEHQRWVYRSRERSTAARFAASKKWEQTRATTKTRSQRLAAASPKEHIQKNSGNP